MSVVKLIDDYLLEFGNERFLEGWNGQQERIINLLQIGGPIEKIICDYWGDPEFDKDDALMLIEQAIKGGN